jgi:DNA-binding response OmpR family regulator
MAIGGGQSTQRLDGRLEIRPEEHAALVDVYVSRLRSKLGKALPDTPLIHTHNGIGYRFSPDG